MHIVLQRAEMTILFHYQALVATLKELTVSPSKAVVTIGPAAAGSIATTSFHRLNYPLEYGSPNGND